MGKTIIEEKERWERYVKACNGAPNPIARRKHEARLRALGGTVFAAREFCIDGRAMA